MEIVSELVAVREPIVARPAVIDAAVNEVVAVRVPAVPCPSVSDDAVMEVVAVIVPTVPEPSVRVAAVIDDVAVMFVDVSVWIVADGTVRALNTRFEIEVVASVEVPMTTSAPLDVSDDVAIREPTRADPWRVVEASEVEVVAVKVPTVSEPTVEFARVAELVEMNVPEVIEPIVALDAARDWMTEVIKFESEAKRFVEVD